MSGVTLQHLHTLQTKHFFEPKQTTEAGESLVSITHVNLCLRGRVLVVAYASSQILVFNWNNNEVRPKSKDGGFLKTYNRQN